MKASELRIGNLINGIYYEYENDGDSEEIEHTVVCKVVTLDVADMCEYPICVYSDEEIEHFSEFEPIPLTEEWLLKFGFKKVGANFELDFFVLWYSSYQNCFVWRFMNIDSNADRPISLEYVHQLQNLYFALFGEELTLKSE